MRTSLTLAGGALLMALSSTAPAEALSMHECSLKYKSARSAGALNGMKWRDFRKAECGASADAAAAAAAPAAPGYGYNAAPSYSNAAPNSNLTTGSTAAPAPRSVFPSSPSYAPGNAVFPTMVSPQYAGQSIGRARMRTCLDQYRANKADNGNGGLRWIMKGGGYYSECNKRLGGR